jgi:dihydrofolate synthase / folylpolyglutamate synthase
MNYSDFSKWITSFHRFGIKLDLNRIKYLCKKLENPQNKYKTIHVAGTNGKGSVCTILESILRENHYKTGIYTSPHLECFQERIKVNNNKVSKEELTKIYGKIKPITDEIQKKNINPTYFEVTTAMAFEYFKQKNVDIAIIEVGLGGRYDATNIVKPVCSVITNVTLEHQNTLGKTMEEIAIQKSGIIKKETPVITAAEKKALNVIKKTAEQKKSPLIIINKKDWIRKTFSDKKQVFMIKTKNETYTIETKLLGNYQGENIALAINTIEQLKTKGINTSKKHIKNGIKNTYNPGRTQVIQKKPYIILDGAHNPEASKKLSSTIIKDFKYNRLILVIGILKDKNIKKILKNLIIISDEIILTQPNNKRAAEIEILEKTIKEIDENKKTISIKNVKKAISKAVEISKNDDLILITGSLYTVGDAKKIFKKQ